MIKNIISTVNKFNLLRPNEKVLIGVSGGPDSICLLHILNQLKDSMGINLHIAHINHMLRGCQSDRDEKFVKELARSLKLPFYSTRIDVAKLAKRDKQCIEDCARRQRHKFLFSVAGDIGAAKVALAHTKDDLVETVLMRLIRGTGLMGLRAILPKNKFNGVDIIRPLIEIDKDGIFSYLKRNNIAYRIDSSNLKTDYFRNKVRLNLIPTLKRYNPQIKNILSDLALNLAVDFEYLAKVSARAFKTVAVIKDGLIKINLRTLKRYHLAVIRMLLREAIRQLKGNLNQISYRNWSRIEELINLKAVNEAVQLAGNICIKKERDYLLVYILKKTIDSKRKCYKLTVPGITSIKDMGLKFEAHIGAPKAVNHKDRCFEYFDFDKIRKPLYVRTWMNSDRFTPIGMTLGKKLHDFFIDEKVEAFERPMVPLLLSKDKIVWICGYRMSNDFKVSDSTKRILKVKMANIAKS